MTNPFDPQAYGSVVQKLLEPPRLPPLGPGTPNQEARETLEKLSAETLFGGERIVDRQMAEAAIAGLWLLHDFLDRSHDISQAIDTTTGSYWHGIMHRREPDYSNAKYWFRRVGSHGVFEPLFANAGEIIGDEQQVDYLADGRWDAFAFVDACQSAARKGGEAETLARRVAQCEWELLFDYCWRSALGR